jgi:MoaA/NifB/PqqE/SkfB family radical SAM enzyme
MKEKLVLSGLHLLLTYRCDMECDHCFVWGSTRSSGTLTLQDVRKILEQARDLRTVEWIYFEGGEPFLYYPVLVGGVEKAAKMGFKVGIVTNGYWATTVEDAIMWLEPLAGQVEDLAVSSDLFHADEKISQSTKNVCAAAQRLGIPVGVITILGLNEAEGEPVTGQLPIGESKVMHRGRAAERLVEGLPRRSWTEFNECPHEDLQQPGRIHIDPLGHIHICQGISLGNLFQTTLAEICASYDPKSHPITGPLLAGGPAELVRRYEVEREDSYVDACHLCYKARLKLRGRFPEILAPDQMYGVLGQ